MAKRLLMIALLLAAPLSGGCQFGAGRRAVINKQQPEVQHLASPLGDRLRRPSDRSSTPQLANNVPTDHLDEVTMQATAVDASADGLDDVELTNVELAETVLASFDEASTSEDVSDDGFMNDTSANRGVDVVENAASLGVESLGVQLAELNETTLFPESFLTDDPFAEPLSAVVDEPTLLSELGQTLSDQPAVNEEPSVMVQEFDALGTAFGNTEAGLSEPRYTVDLPTVLRLAGGDNWSVRLAYERICEAQAQLDAAEVMWLPSLNLGIGYTKHDGQLQATDGTVVDVSRNSLFIGGGAVTANAPTAGGSGGPARLSIDLSLADAYFLPLARRQNVSAVRSRHLAVFNDTLLRVSLAYYDLVSAQGSLALAVENLTQANGLLTMTESFAKAGKTAQSEVTRVQVVVANRRQDVISAELAIRLASARLARVAQLDPHKLGFDTLLQSVETHVWPVEMICATDSLSALISQGQATRAEVFERSARVAENSITVRQEELRPWIPNLHLGVSGGVFGGDAGSNITGLDGRSDIDALLVWQIRNLGLGAVAAQDEARSRRRQAILQSWQVQDVIAAEVKAAWSEVQAGRQQIEVTRETLELASEVYDKNILRIRGLEGLPLEAIQALDAVAIARRNHLNTVIRFNKAQVMLLRAIGQPIEGY